MQVNGSRRKGFMKNNLCSKVVRVYCWYRRFQERERENRHIWGRFGVELYEFLCIDLSSGGTDVLLDNMRQPIAHPP